MTDSKKIKISNNHIQDDYIDSSDENIIAYARAGDNQSFSDIASRYRPLIESIINNYLVPKSERDDLLQESYIGLLKAVRTYDSKKGASFSTYLYICVRNSVLTALNKYQKETAKLIFSDKTPSIVTDSPESLFLSRESTLELYNRFLAELSDYEQKVFELYLSEYTTLQIAEIIDRNEKSVSNAIYRIKIKLQEVFKKD